MCVDLKNDDRSNWDSRMLVNTHSKRIRIEFKLEGLSRTHGEDNKMAKLANCPYSYNYCKLLVGFSSPSCQVVCVGKV